MKDDEQAIRALVATWRSATKTRDVDIILSLIADDVVFLRPGKPEMRKTEFASQARAQAGQGGPEVDATSDIQEIEVAGDWAFMWTRLSVTMAPPGASQPVTRSGHTLTVLRKQHGKWLLARDANLLA